MNIIKTIVADGNEIFRHGLCSILDRHERFEISSDTDNGALVLTAYESIQPDLCILSCTLPEVEGIIIAGKIMEKNPNAKILMFADDKNQQTLNDFLDSGALGLLHKSTHHLELIDAALHVARGERFLGSQFSRMMTREYMKLARQKKRKDPFAKITNREQEILQLLIEGMTSTEIAGKLYISPRTVEKHRTNMLKKLSLKNTAALVRYAMENQSRMLQ